MNANQASLDTPRRDVDLGAAVVITWAVAGGMLLGGAAVAALVFAGRLSGHLVLATSATLYVVGALLGLGHGVLLGVFGRAGGTPRRALEGIAHGAIYLIPALLLGWLVAGWVAAFPVAVLADRTVATLVSVLAWAMLAVTLYAALESGLRAARHAMRRWPDRVAGTLLTFGVLVALTAMVAWERPVIWFTGTRLSTAGSVAFVLAATFWFYGPLITAGLALLRRVRPMLPSASRVFPGAWREGAARIGVAGAAALVVALLAAPFHEGVLGLPTAAERLGAPRVLILAVAGALTNELVFRLFVFTLACVVAARVFKRRVAVVAAAVSVATVLDLLVHYASVPALGLPSASVVAAYLVARLAIPAALFGYVFWRQGLGAAVGAHAAADAAAGMLAI
jgi:hypothetical protein